jgi:hypothetical protein
MRKIMLAATAIAGLGFAATANAQTAVTPATPNFGLPIVPGGAPLDPGTINVYVKGKVYSAVQVGSDSGSSGAGNGGAKLNSTDIMTAMRLYFGFDGKLNNGLEYGANVELRQNYDAQQKPGGQGITEQVRREYVYFGSAQAGRVRLGVVDGPLGLLEAGDFAWQPFDVTTAWLGDVSLYGRTKQTLLQWPSFGGTSVEYMTNKVTYQTPSFAGLELGVSFEPNYQSGMGYCDVNALNGNCYSATTATGTLSPVPSYLNAGNGALGTGATLGTAVGAAGNRENTIEAVARYKGSFGPAAVALELGTMQSGVVKGNAGITHGISEYVLGAEAHVAGFNVLFNGTTGNMNYSSMQPDVNGRAKSWGFQTGVSYNFAHTIVGATYQADVYSPSTAYRPVNEHGVNVGATYDFAPGAAVFLSGLYGTRHAAGFNILTNAAGTAHNTTLVRSLDLGTVFNF